MSAQVFDKDESQHHELTSHEVSVDVVSSGDNGHDLVGLRVAVLVQIHIDGWETDKRCLSSFHHGQPDKNKPENDIRNSWMSFLRNLRILIEDRRRYDNGTEDQQKSRVDILEQLEPPLGAFNFRVLFDK